MNQQREVNILAALAGSLILVWGWIFLPSLKDVLGHIAYQWAFTVFVFGSSAWMLVDALRPSRKEDSSCLKPAIR